MLQSLLHPLLVEEQCYHLHSSMQTSSELDEAEVQLEWTTGSENWGGVHALERMRLPSHGPVLQQQPPQWLVGWPMGVLDRL